MNLIHTQTVEGILHLLEPEDDSLELDGVLLLTKVLFSA